MLKQRIAERLIHIAKLETIDAVARNEIILLVNDLDHIRCVKEFPDAFEQRKGEDQGHEEPTEKAG